MMNLFLVVALVGATAGAVYFGLDWMDYSDSPSMGSYRPNAWHGKLAVAAGVYNTVLIIAAGIRVIAASASAVRRTPKVIAAPLSSIGSLALLMAVFGSPWARGIVPTGGMLSDEQVVGVFVAALYVCAGFTLAAFWTLCADLEDDGNSKKERRRGTARRTPAGSVRVGYVCHYFPKIQVAAVELTDDRLSTGDSIIIRGRATEFRQQIDSMQVDHEDVKEAPKGRSVGIRVGTRARVGDEVFRVVPPE